jgi:hypothetical protein
MECRETGEFAHRETTLYEQFEKFNDEVVAEESGKEEYVHLKSVDDEIEFMDSTMPKGRGKGSCQAEEVEDPTAGQGQSDRPESSVHDADCPGSGPGNGNSDRVEGFYDENGDFHTMTDEELAFYEDALRRQEQYEQHCAQQQKEQGDVHDQMGCVDDEHVVVESELLTTHESTLGQLSDTIRGADQYHDID